jgi:hypothetical protein
MSENTKPLTENSIIDWSSTLVEYREFFIETYGIKKPGGDFYYWLNTQTGKTIKEAFEAYGKESEPKSMDELLSEARFNFISKADKAFITAFDREMAKMGCGFGGSIGRGDFNGRFMIVYSLTAVKSKKAVARIFIRDNEIAVKLILSDVHKHISYIENAAAHIKDVFTGNNGDCACNPKKEGCRMRKIYTIDGKLSEKCSEKIFLFSQPSIEKLQDYNDLLAEFYPAKKRNERAYGDCLSRRNGKPGK